jgi:hypothetical protein
MMGHTGFNRWSLYKIEHHKLFQARGARFEHPRAEFVSRDELAPVHSMTSSARASSVAARRGERQKIETLRPQRKRSKKA